MIRLKENEVRIIEKIRPFLKKQGVVKASLFGSYARAEVRKRSDIDILVKFKGKKSLLDLIRLELIWKAN